MDGMTNSERLSEKDVRSTTTACLQDALADADRVAKQASGDGFCARSRLQALFDAGTFVEMGTYVKRPAGDAFEGVLCGYGAIDGRLTFAFSQDVSRRKGAFDAAHARKLTRLYDAALKNGAPVVGLLDSYGATVYDGVSALAGYGDVMRCVSDASGVIPQIAIIPGVCAGSAAAIAALFDFVIAVKDKTSLYVNSPFLVGETAGTAAYTALHGLAAQTVSEEADAYRFARTLLSLLPANNAEGAAELPCEDTLNRTVDLGLTAQDGYDMKDVLGQIADDGHFTELYADYAPELITGFASFGGLVTGVLASQPAVREGRLTPSAARKAARFVSFCDSYHIPLVTLVDSAGLDVSAEAEAAPYAAELAKLAQCYAVSRNAKITVVLGKAYGASYTLLGSKSLGADMALALDTAAISALPPEAAVAFLWNDQVTETDPETSREALAAKWTAQHASPVEAAEIGEIDDILPASDLRKRLCAELSMLAAKSEYAPERRHPVWPL